MENAADNFFFINLTNVCFQFVFDNGLNKLFYLVKIYEKSVSSPTPLILFLECHLHNGKAGAFSFLPFKHFHSNFHGNSKCTYQQWSIDPACLLPAPEQLGQLSARGVTKQIRESTISVKALPIMVSIIINMQDSSSCHTPFQTRIASVSPNSDSIRGIQHRI